MTGRICISAGQTGGLETEAAARITGLGLEPVLLPAEGPASRRQATLARCDTLVSLFPADSAAHQTLGLAAGMNLPLFILAAGADADPYPAGARVFTNLQALIDALPTGDVGRHVDQQLLTRLGACQAGVDWYLGRYPGGRHSREWTPEEQIAAFADGGAPWLSVAFDYRLIPHHPMDGADFSGADLSSLRLKAASLMAADLTGANLSGAQITGSTLAGANLGKANLKQAVLRRDDLRQATLTGADLTALRADRCQLDGLKAEGVTLRSGRLTSCAGEGVSFAGSSLAGASLEDIDLPAADFSDADLSGVLFRNCRFSRAMFRRADFAGSIFRGCDLGAADFADANFHLADVKP